MLQGLRKSAQGPLMKGLLILLIISFVAWGITGYLSGNRSSAAISVNGKKVSAQEVYADYQNQLRSIQQELGVQLTPEMASQIQLHRQILAGVVQEAVLESFANDIDLAVADRHVQTEVQRNPAFINTDGTFNAAQYQATLRSNGLTSEGYEADVRQLLLRSLLSQMYQAPKAEAYDVVSLLEYEQAEIDFESISVNLEDVPLPAKPSADKISANYEELKDQLKTPEYRSALAVYLDADAMARDTQISDEEIQEAYAAEKEKYRTVERRRARHILVETLEEANALNEQIAGGADFAAIAKEKSKDTFSAEKGGDLDFFEHKEMTPTFAEAAFALEKGVLSEPVQSPFGYHLIEVTDIDAAKQLTVEDAKGSILARLKQEKAEDVFYDLQKELEDRIAGGEKLGEIANDLNLESKVFKNFTQEGYPKVLKDKAPHSKLVAAAYGMFEGMISDAPVDISNGLSAYVELTEVTESRGLTLEEATPQITLELQTKQRQQNAEAKAAKILVEWEKGASGKKVAGKFGVGKSFASHKAVTRNGQNAPKWLKGNAAAALFSVAQGELFPKVIAAGKDYIAVRVKTHRKADITASAIADARHAFTLQVNNDLRRALILDNVTKANVSYDLPVLKQVFGTEIKVSDIPGADRKRSLFDIFESIF